MNRQELKAYIRQHPNNDEAIRELFVNRRSPNAKRYPFPYNMTKELNTLIKAAGNEPATNCNSY